MIDVTLSILFGTALLIIIGLISLLALVVVYQTDIPAIAQKAFTVFILCVGATILGLVAVLII